MGRGLTIAIYYVVNSAIVILLKDVCVEDVFAYKHLLTHFHHLVFTILEEDDDIVDVGTVANELILLHAGTDKSLFTVDIKLFIRFSHLDRLNVLETANFGATWIVFPITLFQHQVPGYCVVGKIVQVMIYFADFLSQTCNVFVRLIRVKLQNTRHLDLHQPKDIVTVDLTDKGWFKGFKPFVDVSYRFVHVGRILKLTILVNPLLDEYLFK